ncbi:MAG TPA: Holliday junction branch migration protein RuvA, partial [candidate division Zixibacteria bacterium]|nr:Holliday junction branch migration protein RuvA [candidate division Zixibacteria bacterium]
TLHTIYYIEAGDMKSTHYPRLVGFTDPVDKEFFQLFTSVPGLGVKKALKSLVMPISEIAGYIEEKSSAGLSRLPGVGPRLADKIVAELSGKSAKFALAKGHSPLATARGRGEDHVDEAIQALLQLQYSRSEAEELVRAALRANPKVKTVEDLIAAVFAASRSVV